MAFLAVDTGSELAGVALLDGDRLVAERAFRTAGRHAERLVPAISDLLREARIDGRELEGVGVTVGPGSFTGLRIGVTTAKTLAWAWRKPLIPVHSLDALALQAASGLGLLTASPYPRPAWIVPLIDARRSGVYVAVYRVDPADGGTPGAVAKGGGSPQGGPGEPSASGWMPAPISLETRPTVTSLSRLAELLPDGTEPVALVGDGAQKGWGALQVSTGREISWPLPSGSDLRPLSVAQLGRMRLGRGESTEAATLTPVYIRRPDTNST